MSVKIPGAWWCGRYGMHRWPMPIAPIAVDLSAYEHVTVCSPIWVFGLAAPMRAFCMAAKGKFIRRIISWCTIIAAIIVPRRMRWIACWE